MERFFVDFLGAILGILVAMVFFETLWPLKKSEPLYFYRRNITTSHCNRITDSGVAKHCVLTICANGNNVCGKFILRF